MSALLSNQKPIYAFIDSQNLNLGVRVLGWKLDFERFRVYLSDKLNVSKAFLFIGYMSKYEKLYDALKSYGYELIFKQVIGDASGKPKGNVDAELVLWAANVEWQNYSKAVVVSGDGDFYCLLKLLQEKRRLERLIVPARYSESTLLKPFDAYKLYVENHRKKLEKKSGGFIK